MHVSLGGHSLGSFYARKLKFSMLLPYPDLTFKSGLELPLGYALGGARVKMYNRADGAFGK